MLKWTVDCEDHYGADVFDKNPGWINYFVDEGLWWDTCWFDSEEEAMDQFWTIMNQYDSIYEVIETISNDNEKIITVKVTSGYSDYSRISKYRVFSKLAEEIII